MGKQVDPAAAIVDLLAKRPACGEGVTCRELASLLKVTHKHASAIVAAEIEAGRIEFAGKKKCRRVDGGVVWAPVYRVTKGAVGR